MKSFAIALAAFLALSPAAFAENALSKSPSLPSVDGVVGPSEYQFSETAAGMRIFATLGSDDTLYIAVQSPSSGWVAAGVGGLVMNGSRLFMGALQDGKPAFQEESGFGHFYKSAANLVVKKWAVTRSEEGTVLELSIPASAALWKSKVNAIFAYSKSPSFKVKHAAHASLSFSVK